jgi:ribosomal protein S12
MLKSLNYHVAKALAVYTGGHEAKKTNSNMAKGLKVQLLLAKGPRVMLIANI